MTNKKGTKRAFLTSVLSLLLCCSMLIGTTFAWFTDTVESGINRIQAGNLDVEVYYGKKALPETNKVAGATNIFTDVDGNEVLWEPGAVAYTNLNVVNEGSLALKYQFAINFANENYIVGTNAKLSQVLKVAFLDAPVSGTREEILDAASGNGVLLSALTKSGVLAKETNQVYGVVIYWEPSDDDNNWNVLDGKTTNDGQPLHIDLGLKLIATQKDAESDSFGPDYDKDAWADGFQVRSAQDLQTAINNGETNIIVMDDIVIPADTSLVIPADTKVTLNLNGSSIEGANAKDLGALIVNNGELEIVGGTMNNTVANGDAVINNTGTLTLKGVNIVGAPMADGSHPAYAVYSTGKLTVEEGATVTSDRGALNVSGETVINGGKIIATDKANGRVITMHTVYACGGTLTINGGEFENNYTGVSGASVICPAGSTINIYGGTFTDAVTDTSNFNNTANIQNYMGYGKPVNVYGGTFNDTTVNKNVASGYKTVETENGWLVISSDRNYAANGVLVSEDGKAYFITNKDGYAWVEAQADGAFAGKTVKLDADLDFGGATLNPIRFWDPENPTVVDGQGHTLSNFVITNTSGNTGLFNGTLKVQNLNVVNGTVTGKYAGIIAGNMYGNIDNCSVKDSVVNGTYWQTGALVGQYNGGNVSNCVVENTTINGLAAVGGFVGIVNESAGVRNFENCTLKNCEINQTGSFGGGYDDMFGAITGYININNSTVNINNCTVEGTELRGEKADTLFGVLSSSTKVYVNGVAQVEASSQDDLNSAISSGDVNITLSEGEYNMPSTGTTGKVTISGTKDTVLNVTLGAYLDSADGVTIEGVTIKTSTGYAGGNGSDYAALYAKDVTYVNCTFVGPMRVGRDGAKFINCTFTELGNDYVWTNGNDVTFEKCTFNTDGKAILIYNDGGNEVSQVSVKNCVFNSTKGAKAGAINNQNCAAIEIHNFGNGVNLVTEGNTYDANFSGEWRIKTYETGKTQVFVNGTEYTTIALDGKTMTIDSNKNVTVNN